MSVRAELLERVLAAAPDSGALHQPTLAPRAWEYVKDCLDSGMVSTSGEWVTRLEAALSESTQAPEVIATISGTAALHVALLAVGVQSGDEVLVPPLTYVSTANAVIHANAVPHFVECEPVTLGVDPEKLERYLARVLRAGAEGATNRATGRRVAALLVVHVLGHPVALEPLARLCERFDLRLVEDAAQALGSEYQGQAIGCLGDLGVISLNGNKMVTAGGGGAVISRDRLLARRVRHLVSLARTEGSPYEWDAVGFNYRLPALNAALGAAQLERLPDLVTAKRHQAGRYRSALEGSRSARFVDEPPGCRSNFWIDAALLAPEIAASRDAMIADGARRGLGMRPAWPLLSELPMYRRCPSMVTEVAADLQRRLVQLPSDVGAML